MMPDRRATMKRICRGCGCTDDHACITDDGEACSWVLLDIMSPSGICSFCADEYEWNPEIMQMVGFADLRRAGVIRQVAP